MHLVDTTMFYAPHGGGVGRYLAVKHAWLQARTSVRHTIVAPGGADAYSVRGLVTVRSPLLSRRQGYRFPLALRVWQQRLEQLSPDMVEVGDPYVPAWAALRAGQELAVPVIGFYHSDLPRAAAIRVGRWIEPVFERYVSRLYSQFDLVVAPSRHVQRRLASLGISRVTCQPLGVDPEVFTPLRRDAGLRKELGLASDTRLLVFAGRFAREKNLALVQRAVARLGKPYHLLLVGSGRAPVPQQNVTVMPFECDSAKLARILASCDALVHAGDQETFGLVVLEAMACGLPVIVANRGAAAELVSERTAIVVEAKSVEALAEGVRALWDRDRSAMGREARRSVEAGYSWDAVMHSLLRTYAGVVSRPVHSLVPSYAAD